MNQTLEERIRAELARARRTRRRRRTRVLSTLLAEIRNRQIDASAELSEAEVQGVVARAAKQRREACALMEHAGRGELARAEDAERRILEEFLPRPLTEREVRELTREIIAGGAAQIGPVMGALMPKIRGRFDGGSARKVVLEELG